MKILQETNLLNLLFLNNISGLGPKTILVLLNNFKNAENILNQNYKDLQNIGLKSSIIHQIINKDFKQAEQQLKLADKYNVNLISLEDSRYPCQLKNIYDPPVILYVKGNVELLNLDQVAIVGSRNLTSCGMKAADYFAYNLAKEGLVITSGLARGVDYYAHQATLRSNITTGITIGVMGTSIDEIYPKEHCKLVNDILINNGCIVSELPFTTPPKAQNFPRRNRIISGLSKGVIVVEAKEKSGSLITARMALEQNRDIFAVPGSIFNKEALGTNLLLQNGAKLILSVQDVLEELNLDKVNNLSEFKNKTSKINVDFNLNTNLNTKLNFKNKNLINNLDSDSQKILKVLDDMNIENKIASYDYIISNSKVHQAQLSVLLMNLELDGFINKVPGGYLKIV